MSDGFEGPEKRLEIEFKRNAIGEGLFALSQAQWQKLLDYAKCEIIGAKQSDDCKMFVLSESSLFVYRHKLMVKTCGTTSLLEMAEPLLECVGKEANEWNKEFKEGPLALEVEFVSFSRKNFLWPEKQPKVHENFQAEIALLEKLFPGGAGYVLGPVNKEHWNIYIADYTAEDASTANPADQTLEVIMHGLDKEKMQQFFNEDGKKDADAVTQSSGIADILPGSLIDAKLFEPCGYSMNGLCPGGKWYWTIHITPEDHCSFVSFETNCPKADYTTLVECVMNVFKPEKCFVTLFSDKHSESQDNVRTPLFGSTRTNGFGSVAPLQIAGMTKKHNMHYEFGEPYSLFMLDFENSQAGA